MSSSRPLWLCVVALMTLLGCHRTSDTLAQLEAKLGVVDRDLAATQGKWEAAALGGTFKVGDGVRTASGATATLRLSDGSGVALKEKTLLRFLAAPPGKKTRRLDIQTGEVELTVASEALELETQDGPAVLQPGSRVQLRKLERGLRLSVEIGAARLTSLNRELNAGDSIEVGIGQAVVEPAPSAASQAPTRPGEAPLAAATPSASAATAPGTPDTRPRGPELADLLAGPGESLIVHDPHPPTVVGFVTSHCSGLVVLELGARKRETVGQGRVSAAVPAGTQRYRLRCDEEEKPFAEGTLSVVHDAGNRRLASAAPANRIDTDGRRYTILYQSLLPKVSVRWPNPPSTGPLTLTLTSQGKGQRQFSSPAPSYALPGGALTEGSHELWFEGHGERSRQTTVLVQFDNAAPMASISSPAERGFAPGSAVSVAGTALPGWTVSVNGRELAQDGQQRFSGDVAAPTDVGALAIRFSHPQRGVRYYLRRSSR
jgi:hypothetical protein